MNVCACGNPMMKGEPWCKRCWAVWSTWFMRAQGKWINFETGLRHQGEDCDCLACTNQKLTQHLVDRHFDPAVRQAH